MSNWNAREQEALATIGLLAAQSDGRRDAEELKRLASVFTSFAVVGVDSVYARVALGNAVLEEEAAALGSPEARQAAWELAVGVCHADGVVAEREQAFLDRLGKALGLDAAASADATRTAAALAPMELSPTAAAVATAVAAVAPAGRSAADGGVVLDAAAETALDEKIRQAAIFAGALELLPQGLATLGIVPVQLKLVADVGTAYGHQVDAG